MDNKVKRVTCTSMEKTNSRQFIIVFKMIIPITVVHFPNEINQKRSQYLNWSCNYKHPEFSPTFNLFLAFHIIFSILIPLNQLLSLARAKISPVSKHLNSTKILQCLPLPKFLCVTSIYTQPIRSCFKLSKQTLIS